ncbi:MAG: AMP-binding protein [Clostridia bacterium]|nr:AMP-binding protein [Clostridia bacterium]MBP3708491.1 AMP-binding protein [Clostridia bacterium]
MSEKLYKYIEITDLKDMMNKTRALYNDAPAYIIKLKKDEYKIYSHEDVRAMVDALGTALIDIGLKGKRIAVIGPNRMEWEIAYLSVVCGTGTIVPLDKSLPDNELESLIERSEVEAIFYSKEYEERLMKIKYSHTNKLKHLISMDNPIHSEGIYSQSELIEKGRRLIKEGNKAFVEEKINPEEMSIMLFTSGTTSASKVVALSHKNIVSNLMALGSILNVNQGDVFLSVLPVHHAFECTVGFLFALYKGGQTAFCDGLRHISENLKEYKVSVLACVPGIYERLIGSACKKVEKNGKIKNILEKEEQCKNLSLTERKKIFKEIHDEFGGNIKLLISGAAALDPKIEEKYINFGFPLVQGYGLTETSPVIGVGTEKEHRIGSIGKPVPGVEVKIMDSNSEGIGELVVKGPNVMMEYYEDKKATKEALQDGWFHTGDLAQIDDDGYIFIRGRKKSVIVLKNGKNIFPEEIENLVNKIEGVKESFIFGKQLSDDKDDIKINCKIVFDRPVVQETYKVFDDKEINTVLSNKVKEINKAMPPYKAIRGLVFTEDPLIKTSTNKIKRQDNLDAIRKLGY